MTAPSQSPADSAEIHLATLKRAARMLSSSADLDDALGRTIEACLPAVGDFGFFDARVGDEVVRTARAFDAPDIEAILRPTQWMPQEREDMNLCALSTGKPGFHPDIDDEWYRKVAQNEGHLAVLRELAFRSMITVPMFSGEGLVGSLTLFMGRSGRRHTMEDLRLAEDLASLAAPVVANVRLLAAERTARADAEAARLRLELLTVAGRRLSGSPLDTQATLETIADVLVPQTVDWCRVDLIDASGQPQAALVRHATRKDLSEQALALARRWRAPASAPGTIDWVIANRQPHLGGISARQLELIDDPDVAALVREIGPRSSLIVPLVARGRTLGAIAVLQAESGRTFGEDDLPFFAEVAQRAALALDNARLFAEAEAARTEAEKASRAKDEFLAVLGHELRNPLSPIVTALYLMDRRGDESNARERAVISRQVAHLSRLVDDLLDVSRIAQGRIQLKLESVDIASVVSAAVDAVRPSLASSELQCSLQLPPGPVEVRADPIRLTQVFSNLLINARKFTPGGGTVSVVVSARPADVEIAVSDTGCGIAPELLPRVFDLFTQGPQAIERQHGGLGLGLAIARSLITMHGGSITVESEGSGKGCTFRVRLPRQTASTGAIITSERPTGLRGNGERVLVVDDHADVRETVFSLLTAEGYKARSAANAQEALDIVPAFRPDLALLDIGMPGMDGYELARTLRQQPDSQALRLLAITGYGGEADRRQALQAGFDDHIVKPVPAALLLQTVKALLKGRR